jgi:hypothetical protein
VVVVCGSVFMCMWCLCAAASTWRSITACTNLVGLHVIFSMLAISVILRSSAATASCTLLAAIISSTPGMCVNPFCLCYVWAYTFCSYRSIAVLIFASTFFSIISSLIPILAYKLDAVRVWALVVGACC